mgnify:CR=1 FL=1
MLSYKGKHDEAVRLLKANMDKHVAEYGEDDDDTKVATSMYIAAVAASDKSK